MATSSAPVSKKQAADELTAASPRSAPGNLFPLHSFSVFRFSFSVAATAVAPAVVIASPRPEDSIPDLEKSELWPGQEFKWADVGLSPGKSDQKIRVFALLIILW